MGCLSRPATQTNGLEDYSAVALFLQCARQFKVDFEVLPGERPALAKVCQLVEGTPLAIELAAAWVGVLSMEEIAQEITSNLDFLTTQVRNVPERHRSLRAVFAHSWKLLSVRKDRCFAGWRFSGAVSNARRLNRSQEPLCRS